MPGLDHLFENNRRWAERIRRHDPEFFSKLSSKAEEAGRKYIAVNPAYTSQTCSTCGHRQKMPLDMRVFTCPCCHLQLDRDLNAAKNICSLGRHALGLSLEVPAF